MKPRLLRHRWRTHRTTYTVEIVEMTRMLREAGYRDPAMWARKFRREGMGPAELEHRLRQGHLHFNYPILREAALRRRDSRRDARRRPSKTREQWLASLRWNIKDAAEALKNAVEMGDMAGVRKYAGQIERLSQKLHDAEWSRASKKRERRVYSHYVQHQSAGLRFGRGRLP